MKRASTEYSLILGINKPEGLTSHDVVNRVRKIFNERRVGHAGTLDPCATGVLPIMVGPATRLSDNLSGHDKTYIADICFGISTSTDDKEGEIIRTCTPSHECFDMSFASKFLSSLIGKHNQIPPAYSAIKVNGKKSYQEARKGNIIDLAKRPIEIYSCELIDILENKENGLPIWRTRFCVSSGTYIRSIARDIGLDLGLAAYLSDLCRESVGSIELEDCISLEALNDIKDKAALDPVYILGYKFIYADDFLERIRNGQIIDIQDIVFYVYEDFGKDMCQCMSHSYEFNGQLANEEMISVIAQNKLVALYSYDQNNNCLKCSKVFSIGVCRDNC